MEHLFILETVTLLHVPVATGAQKGQTEPRVDKLKHLCLPVTTHSSGKVYQLN